MRTTDISAPARESSETGPATLASNITRDATRRWLAGAILTATLLGAGLRLFHLDSASFWEDELKTIRDCAQLTEINRSKVFGYLPTAVTLWLQGIPPNQIPVAHPDQWRAMGITEGRARLASAIMGIVSIPCLALACYPLVGARAAGILGLFLAVAPWHLYWSQAARFYTQQFLFYNLCLVWYFRATQTGSRGRMVGALVMLLLAFLTQPPALVILMVVGADWLVGLIRKEPVRLGWTGWIGFAAVLAICALVLRLDVKERTGQWAQFIGDTYNSPVKMVVGSIYLIMPAVALTAVLFLPSMLATRRRLAIYLVLAGILPILVFAAAATKSYVGLRYTFVSLFPFLVLAAMGCGLLYETLRERVGRLAAATLPGILLTIMAFTDYTYYTAGYGYHERWREAFAYVAQYRQPGEPVYVPGTSLPCPDGKTIIIESLIGRYYLEDGSVIAGLPTVDALRALPCPAWLVIEARDGFGRRRQRWLDDTAELKAYFNLRVVQPSSSVHVYRFVPPRDARGAGDASDVASNERSSREGPQRPDR